MQMFQELSLCHMAFRWRADDGPALNAGLVLQVIMTNFAWKPYIFVIFQGGGGGLYFCVFQGGGGPDPLSSSTMDPRMIKVNTILYLLNK